MPLTLEKRLALMAEASNLLLAGSARLYGRNSGVGFKSRIRNKPLRLKRAESR
jgi:hypothetical protein